MSNAHRILTSLVLTLLLALVLALPTRAAAQSGRISGTVSDTSGAPVVGAHVLIPALGLSAQSGAGGRFSIGGVPAGSYDIKAYHIGYRASSRSGVVVTDGAAASVRFTLEATALRLTSVVVSASRHAEKITDAAATINAVDATALESRVGNSYTLALRNLPGLDVTQIGITSVFVNGRGFNNRFNTRWRTLDDGRVALLAETGLPVGEHTTIPVLDVASMEVLTGTGSALHGANASNGLLSVRSKDTREYQGLSTEVSGGSRSLCDVQEGTRGAGGNALLLRDTAPRVGARHERKHERPHPAVPAKAREHGARDAGGLRPQCHQTQPTSSEAPGLSHARGVLCPVTLNGAL